uniref:Uncharacterized protein n=1 Tax=Tanacetum cinerariifolium TaxID=118510 RepID=A0A6L2LSS4_TANCI|nr:hypothetical protein [Tanacetum cinerariifolium]
MDQILLWKSTSGSRKKKLINVEECLTGKLLHMGKLGLMMIFTTLDAEFPAIVVNDDFVPQDTLQCKSQVSTPVNDEIDFRISFDKYDDEDYIIIYDKNSFSYKMIYVNNFKTDSENDNEKVMPSIPSPEPMTSYIDDLDFFNDFENEFPAIEEQNVLYFNDLFPFNIIRLDDLKSEKDNDNNEVDIIQSFEENEITHESAIMLFYLIMNLCAPFAVLFDPKRYYKDGDCAIMLRRPRHAEGRKSGARLSRGHFIGRLAHHFGLVSDDGLRGLSVVAWDLLLIDMGELVKLNICMNLGDDWDLVAPGPKRQQVAAAGTPDAAEDVPAADEGGQAVLAPVQAPQQPPPPSLVAVRTMPKRLGRLEEEVQRLRRDVRSLRGLVERSMTDQVTCVYPGVPGVYVWSLSPSWNIGIDERLVTVINRNLDNSTSNVLISLDSWTRTNRITNDTLSSLFDHELSWTDRKVKHYEDEDDCSIDFKTEFPAIVFDNTTIPSEPKVCPLNESELDFRISLEESDDEDYTVIFDENSFTYKMNSVNDLKKMDSGNDKPLSPNPTVDYFDDLDYFNDFENEFPAIVYNDGLTSKSDIRIKPLRSSECIDEINLIDETSLSEYDEEIVSRFNDLFNDIHPDDLKLEKDDDDNNISIIQSSEDNKITQGENGLSETSHDKIIKTFETGNMEPLPPDDQRHPWLRYEVEGYTSGIIHSYEQRLETIWSRLVNWVYVLDFAGLSLEMRHDLAVRLRMVYSGEGQLVFVSHAWRMSDTVMDLDTADTLCFQLGGVRRRMTWRQFILALGLHTEQEMAEAGFGAYWVGITPHVFSSYL